MNNTLTSITLVSQITGYSTRLFVQPIVKANINASRWAFLALCEGNPSVTDGFPSQKASNAASVGPILVQSLHTTIGVTLCQRWPNVSVPTLRRCWHNVGAPTLGQLTNPRWPNVGEPTLAQRKGWHGPTLGQRRNASWVGRLVLMLTKFYLLIYITQHGTLVDGNPSGLAVRRPLSIW